MTERLSRRFDRAFIEKLNLHYLDSTNNLGSIAALLKVTARRKKLCGIAIDYLQLLQVTANRHDNREREIARCSQRMKRLALDLEIPVIVGSQLNRESEKRAKPTLADLRESGQSNRMRTLLS
ncbi:MAG UNVERIFIED_CONTAM: DnaB-like helicase C-terminal domain-containing protein [Planctomycetaceae bacterium]